MAELLPSRLTGRLWKRWFREQSLPLASWNLFDLGVVDVRRRGHLDIFTANHNSRQSLLENDGDGCFKEVITELGLDQERIFPGWTDDVNQPHVVSPGLYLYRRKNTMVLRSVGAPRSPVLSGALLFSSPVRVAARANLDVAIDERFDGGGPGTSEVRFTAEGDGFVDLEPELVGLPVTVILEHGVPLSAVFVGPTMTVPGSHEFVLRLQDRHGMAWADCNGDGRLDVFIARGGLRGRLADYGGMVRDELFVDDGSGLHDDAARLGIEKGTCRSRQAAWVDLGGDHGLDLFVSCHGAPPQCHRPGPDGRFVDVAAGLGLAEVRSDHFRWVDVDGDGRVDLVVADRGCLVVYHQLESGRFDKMQVLALRGSPTRVRTLAIGDYDGDADPDIFAPAPEGNTLLVNEGGQYRAVDPRAVGLPDRGSVVANWVDFDNDGLTDLHLVPGGLFRQRSGGRFRDTGLLGRHDRGLMADARATWFDANGDGSRDVVIAVVEKPKSQGGGFDWTAKLFRNVGARNGWLEVELVGPPRNPHAVGSTVQITAAGRTLTQWVGASDGSHFSQGHYRLYFGLGDQAGADGATVRWWDGAVSTLGRTGSNRLLTVRYEDRS